MIPYILHVALLISVCLLFYKLLLQRETFYRLNRLILISCLCLSFILPLISIPQDWAFTNQQITATAPEELNTRTPVFAKVEDYASPSNFNQSSQSKQPQNSMDETAEKQPLIQRILQWAFYIYWIGVAAFTLNFLLQLFVLLYQAYTKPVIRDGRFRIVELDGDKAPCSFANNIFINPSKYDWDTYNQVLLHEKIHIQQRHSLDILIAEIVLIFQWFNPFAWLYRKELENNLEFLTDDAVLDNNIEKQSYQESLLKVSAPHLSLGITTNYNQSLLKKRIIMMNTKRSSLRTMWKYFFLAPLLICLMCGLNNTIAYSQAGKPKKDDNTSSTHHSGNRATEGSWFATIKKDKIRFEFRSDDDEHNWSNSTDFMLNEFPSLPKTQKGDFTLTREAGSILFNGKFDDDQGYGHYKFTGNKDFADFLSKQGITGTDESDLFSFFIVNVKKDYVEMLGRNGYKDLSKNELISMAALKVDEPYIQMWKQNGYKDLSPNELVSGKALNIDNAYVSEIHKAGYKDLSFNQLISFKAQHITGEYINSLQKAKLKDGKSTDENVLPDPNQLSAYKAMNIDSSYIHSFEAIGYRDIPYNELTTMKALHITPEFVKGFQEMGYKDISVNSLASLKSLSITPEYIKAFQEMGYKDISINSLSSLKSMNVNKDFIKSFNDLGYSKIPLNDLVTLKSLHITPEYVKAFQALGFKDIELNELIPLKSLDITPEYINGFKKLGFTDISLKELPGLKSTGVTPEYITSMREKGFKSNDLNKYMRLKTAFE